MRVANSLCNDRRSGRHDRYERYRTVRRHHRRVGFVWAIFAAVVLLCAWDVAGRIDDVAYNVASIR